MLVASWSIFVTSPAPHIYIAVCEGNGAAYSSNKTKQLTIIVLSHLLFRSIAFTANAAQHSPETDDGTSAGSTYVISVPNFGWLKLSFQRGIQWMKLLLCYFQWQCALFYIALVPRRWTPRRRYALSLFMCMFFRLDSFINNVIWIEAQSRNWGRHKEQASL